MSMRCTVCHRGSASGNRRSHSNIATRRKFHINLQHRRVDGVRVRICTRCLRTKLRASTARAK